MLNYLAHGGISDSSTYLSSSEVSVSWLAIFLATLAAMVIGSIWYGPLFGKQWMKAVGLKKKDLQGGSWWPMVAMVGLALAQAVILAHFIAYASNFYFDFDGWVVGVLTGLWAFAGFIAPVLISNTMFSKGSTELLKINLSNQFVTLLVMGVILGSIT
ncbi:MAG TPA: DUF1761 domain-containing protein [Candidatus Saccharimonadales bacterium]|nr:DUF1761 domain-containing protein [Candidatus Saccharimonadales bacterium]